MAEEAFDFDILAAELQQLEFLVDGEIQLGAAAEDNLVDALLLLQDLLLDLGLVVLELALVVYLHFPPQVDDHLLLVDFELGFLGDVVGEDLNAADQVGVLLLEGADAETGEDEAEEIVPEDLHFLHHPIP